MALSDHHRADKSASGVRRRHNNSSSIAQNYAVGPGCRPKSESSPSSNIRDSDHVQFPCIGPPKSETCARDNPNLLCSKAIRIGRQHAEEDRRQETEVQKLRRKRSGDKVVRCQRCGGTGKSGESSTTQDGCQPPPGLHLWQIPAEGKLVHGVVREERIWP